MRKQLIVIAGILILVFTAFLAVPQKTTSQGRRPEPYSGEGAFKLYLPLIINSNRNLIVNGRFESGDLTGIASQAGGSSCQIVFAGWAITTTVVDTGTYAIGETHNYPLNDVGQGRCFTTNRYRIVASSNYQFSIRYDFIINFGAGDFTINIIWRDALDAQSRLDPLVATTANSEGWATGAQTFTAPANAITFEINVRSSTLPAVGGSTVTSYVDNMSAIGPSE